MDNIIKILVISLLICSCGRKDCGFPDTDLNWVSYHESDSLFYSDNKDIIKFKVVNFFKTSPTYISYIVMDPMCRDSAYYYTNEDLPTGYFINESYSLLGEPKMRIQLSKDDIFIFDPTYIITNDFTSLVKAEYHVDTTINSINYHDVYVLKKDTIKTKPRIAWIIKSKTKGIIAFYDFNSKQKWYLTNK
jgi:hypothetical protein